MQGPDQWLESLDGITDQAGMLPGIDGHSAGNRVPDAGAGPRVSRFHDDEGPLLQSHHPEVLRVVQRLQEEAVAGPGVVAQAQVPVLPPAHLQGGNTNTLGEEHRPGCSGPRLEDLEAKSPRRAHAYTGLATLTCR